MTILAKSGPVAVAQRNTTLMRHHSGASKHGHPHAGFLLDTSLSSSQFSLNSTRHSVTSRIQRNSRAFCYLIFSTRHLNATPEKRGNSEKFNIRLRFSAASPVKANRGLDQLFEANGKLADAHACGMVDGAGDGRSATGQAALAHSPRAIFVEFCVGG